jgi:hypothetical protein
MRLHIVPLLMLSLLLSGCSRNSRNADLAHQGVTVCGTVTDDNHQPVANAFIELHHSAKDAVAIQTRYQVGRTDAKGQFELQGIPEGQYWLAIVARGQCNPKSRDENESRRIEVDVPTGTAGPECKTQWQLLQDASCKVTLE